MYHCQKYFLNNFKSELIYGMFNFKDHIIWNIWKRFYELAELAVSAVIKFSINYTPNRPLSYKHSKIK